MLERLRRFRALERQAQILFLRSLLLLPLVSLSLKWRGFGATRTTLERSFTESTPLSDAAEKEGRAAITTRMVHAAVRYGVGRPSCLEESLVLWYLLGRQGIASQLRIGIRKEDGKFGAHAWVERNSEALNQPDAQHRHYAAFDASFSTQPPETE
jgi:hypothetical protein